jgi:hypothetical protein
MQEDLVELRVARDSADLVRVREQVIARDAARGLVLARVVFAAEPGPVLGGQVGQRQGRVAELVLDLLAPRAVPAPMESSP